MSPISKSGKKAATGMTLGEHLIELRTRLMISVGAVLVFMAIVGFVGYNDMLKLLQQPYCSISPHHCTFLATGPLDGLTLRIKIALFGGLFLASPIVFYEIWRFITPGLKAKEKKYIIPFVTASLVFFAGGALLAYYSFEHALKFLQAVGGSQIHADYQPNSYLTLILLMMFIFGLTFEFPVILVSLELANIVTPHQLLRAWRWAIIGIVVISAVITPSGDPFSMLALAVPLVGFYFASIGVGKLARK